MQHNTAEHPVLLDPEAHAGQLEQTLQFLDSPESAPVTEQIQQLSRINSVLYANVHGEWLPHQTEAEINVVDRSLSWLNAVERGEQAVGNTLVLQYAKFILANDRHRFYKQSGDQHFEGVPLDFDMGTGQTHALYSPYEDGYEDTGDSGIEKYAGEEEKAAIASVLSSVNGRDFVATSFGVEKADLHGIPADAALLYLMRSDGEQFSRLQNVLQKTGSVGKSELFQGFLAIEFGDELGDSVLDIAENCPSEITGKLMREVSVFRHISPQIGELFSAGEKRFAGQVEQALVKRVSEVLAVAAAIAKGVPAEATLYNGQVVTEESIENVFVQLRLLNSALTASVGSLHLMQPTAHASHDGVENYWYNGGKVLLQLRPEGNKDFDKDYQFDGEARINLLYNPDEPIAEKVGERSRQQALSIRLDREGITRNADGEMIGNDPELEKGAISLDIGSIFGDEDNLNVSIGRVLAIGNAIIAKKRGERPNFSHVRETFDAEYGVDNRFARIVRSVKNRLRAAPRIRSAFSRRLAEEFEADY